MRAERLTSTVRVQRWRSWPVAARGNPPPGVLRPRRARSQQPSLLPAHSPLGPGHLSRWVRVTWEDKHPSSQTRGDCKNSPLGRVRGGHRWVLSLWPEGAESVQSRGQVQQGRPPPPRPQSRVGGPARPWGQRSCSRSRSQALGVHLSTWPAVSASPPRQEPGELTGGRSACPAPLAVGHLRAAPRMVR